MGSIYFDMTNKQGAKTKFVLNTQNIGYLVFDDNKKLEIHTNAGMIVCEDCGGVEKVFDAIHKELAQ